MKKAILMMLLVVCQIGFSQSFSVTPYGLKDSQNNENGFIVLNFEGKTAKQLYDLSINFINKSYKNPDKVIKGKVEGEFLSFDTYADNFISIKNGFVKSEFNTQYTTKLSFKDGKVRFEIIALSMYNGSGFELGFMGGGGGFFVYNKKGDLKKEDAKTQLENYFNKRVLSLSEYLAGKSYDDKW